MKVGNCKSANYSSHIRFSDVHAVGLILLDCKFILPLRYLFLKFSDIKRVVKACLSTSVSGNTPYFDVYIILREIHINFA